MSQQSLPVPSLDGFATLRAAARDSMPIAGSTHCFYRYPARFSPTFARAAVSLFSRPGQVVLDPYMGGGTTVVEAMAAGRRAIGCDINELALFVTKVKTTRLSAGQRSAIVHWSVDVVPAISYFDALEPGEYERSVDHARNLDGPSVRPIKKCIALALAHAQSLPGLAAQNFARCVLLNAGQWALNGRRRPATIAGFRERVRDTTAEMLAGADAFADVAEGAPTPGLHCGTAAELPGMAPFRDGGTADLVVTSPPYPGVHILYHRWQVDGRKESPAPYWIAACRDGNGSSFYTFADRRNEAADAYFAASLRTLLGIRAVLRSGAYFVQMIAFGDPRTQLPRYLANMDAAGFAEVRLDELGAGRHSRIWRQVPGRRWHANMKGSLNSAREVVLVHRAA